MIPGIPLKPDLINKEKLQANSKSKHTSKLESGYSSSKQPGTNFKQPNRGKFAPEEKRSSLTNLANSDKKSLRSKYSVLPNIRRSLDRESDIIEFQEKQKGVDKAVETELILAVRLPSGKKVVKKITNQSQTLLDLVKDVSKEAHEQLDLNSIQCLDASTNGGPKMFSEAQMGLPIRKLTIVNRSLLIFQYSN